jgi:hypothetical protein
MLTYLVSAVFRSVPLLAAIRRIRAMLETLGLGAVLLDALAVISRCMRATSALTGSGAVSQAALASGENRSGAVCLGARSRRLCSLRGAALGSTTLPSTAWLRQLPLQRSISAGFAGSPGRRFSGRTCRSCRRDQVGAAFAVSLASLASLGPAPCRLAGLYLGGGRAQCLARRRAASALPARLWRPPADRLRKRRRRRLDVLDRRGRLSAGAAAPPAATSVMVTVLSERVPAICRGGDCARRARREPWPSRPSP